MCSRLSEAPTEEERVSQDYSSQVQKQKTDTGAYAAWAMCIKSDRKSLHYPKIQKMITYNRVGF